MYGRTKLKIYANGVVALFMLLALFSTAASAAHGGGCEVCLSIRDLINIDILEVYEFEDPFFEVHSSVGHHCGPPMYIKLTHVLIYPSGKEEQTSWFEGVIERGQAFDMYIFCMYITNEVGKYSWRLTVENEKGAILDQQVISWVREPF